MSISEILIGDERFTKVFTTDDYLEIPKNTRVYYYDEYGDYKTGYTSEYYNSKTWMKAHGIIFDTKANRLCFVFENNGGIEIISNEKPKKGEFHSTSNLSFNTQPDGKGTGYTMSDNGNFSMDALDVLGGVNSPSIYINLGYLPRMEVA